MTFDETVDFCRNNPEIAAIILMNIEQLEEDLIKANAEIKRLKEIIDKDSFNSSKPPSTDNKFSKKPKSKKNTLKKKRGGQQGHSGQTLKMVENPDKVVVLEVSTCNCGQCLSEVNPSKTIKRQAFDLPKIKMIVTQFEQHTKVCPSCKAVNTKAFPKNISTSTQYGNNLRSFMAYCNTYQIIPYDCQVSPRYTISVKLKAIA